MTAEVTVCGRVWTVAIDPASEQPRQVAVTVDGTRRVLDVSWIDADTVSLIDSGGAACEIRLHRRENGAVGVEIDGVVHEAVVSLKRGREGFSDAGSGKTPPDPVSDARPDATVRAPMPGRVVRLLAAVGDQVAARDGLVVIEAMKMENELRSPRAGVVKEIRHRPGQAVEAGTVLIVIGD